MNKFLRLSFVLVNTIFLAGCGDEAKTCNYSYDMFGYPYIFPNVITLKNNDYQRIKSTDNEYPTYGIVNDELVGFLIKQNDVDQFVKEYPGIDYFVFSDLYYYFGKNSRVPLYSIVGDDELKYLSNPEYFIYVKWHFMVLISCPDWTFALEYQGTIKLFIDLG